MRKRDAPVYLRRMLDDARIALSLVEGGSPSELEHNGMLIAVLLKRLGFVKWHADHVSDEGRARYPGIPWPELIRFQNPCFYRSDSGYFDILWDNLTRVLPRLVESLENILGPEKTDE